MRYEIGDYVVPSDLPRRWVCRVEEVERRALEGGETIQILTLAPLGGPWRPGTLLVRLDGSVRPTKGRGGAGRRIARAAAAAKRAHDGTVPAGGAKVIRLPVQPRRLPVEPPVAAQDAHD